MRGVSTVGGWHCSHVDESLTSWKESNWGFPTATLHLDSEIADLVATTIIRTREEARALIRAGDLLPSVDPEDSATWACLVKDLAKAAFPYLAHGGKHAAKNVSFQKVSVRDHWTLGHWTLVTSVGPHSFPEISTDDPGLALVLALIQLRERNSK